MAPPPLCLLLLRHGNTLPRLPAQNHIRLLCAGFGDITVLTNRDGVLSLFVRNGKDQVQLIISSAPHPRPHAQLEDTHVFEGVFLRLGEEEQNRGEDDDTVQRGEKGVRAPTDIGEHGSGDHDLRVRRSALAARDTREGCTHDEEIEEPVGSGGQSVGRSSDPQWCHFGRIQPSHTEPADGEPRVEQEQHEDREDLCDSRRLLV